MSLIIERVLVVVLTVFIYVLKILHRVGTAIGTIVHFAILVAFLMLVGDWIEGLRQPYQTWVISGLAYWAATSFISLLALAVWRPKKFEQIMKKLSKD